MSLFIYNSEIIDRERESDEIAAYICSQTNKNRILWVCADTGVGKTSLIEKALQKQSSSKIIVTVKTPPINYNDCVIQGQYSSYIAAAVNECLRDYEGTLEDFILSGVKNRIGKAEIQKILESDIAKIPQAMLSTIISRYTQYGINDVEKYLLDTDINSTLIQREYLNYSLSTNDVILYISNMQNIDSRSLDELKKIIDSTNNNFFLFEFTTENMNLDLVHKYNDLFKEIADIAIERLDMLPIHYAASIIGTDVVENYPKWENYYKKIICGNLYKLQNIDIKAEQFSSDPLDRIYKLEMEGIVLLQIIILHDGQLSSMKFYHILNNCDIRYTFYFENHFDKISSYVEKNNEEIKLIHSSIKDFLTESTNIYIEKSKLIAYSILRNVFNEDLSKCNYNWYTKKELIFHLIKLYSANSTEKIIEILEGFKELIVDGISVEQINLLLDQLFNEIGLFSNKQIILKIIKICYDFGLYSKAYEFLREHFINDVNFYMYNAILLNRLDKHKDCIDYCNMIEKESDSSRFYLVIQLIKMLSLRTLNKKHEYRQLYFELLNDKKCKELLEYGFLLRNSELLYSPVNDIPYIKRSIQHFQEHHNIKNEIYAKITLATEYAYAGKILEARELLFSVKDIFLKTTTEKHIFYNDIAAVELEGKSATNLTLVNLEKGLLTSRNSYDTLTILSNKICWYILNNETISEIDSFIKQLKLYINIEPDLRICKRIYFNLYQYYKHIERNNNSARYYFSKVVSMRHVLDDKLDRLLINSKSHNNKPQIYVSFITYWHFDIPNL